MEKVVEPAVLFGKSKWIWSADATKKNTEVIMRRTFTFGQDKPPAKAICRAACDTHYFLFVNGTAVVWNGGLNRSAHSAYYDEFDIGKYLIKGDNVIVCYCRYYGNAGRDVVCAERAGFIFECNDLEIYSDSSFTVYESRAYKTPPSSNCCYAGYGINYDASLEGQIQNVLSPTFNSSLFVQATEHDSYPDAAIGVLQPRPLPLELFSQQPITAKKFKKSTDQFDGDTYTVVLPREMCVTPYFEVTGNGQEKITIVTDRTACGGCYGDESSVYYAHSIEYMTKPTLNIYDSMLPMTGSVIKFSMPRTVKVIKLGYRELGYNAQPTCEFETGDDNLDALYQKAVNTLYACMGSTIMDTPERERTMWLGDVSLAARALYLTYGDSTALVKKVIDDVLEYAEDGVLYSCVPGNIPADIPSHGLIALSEYGLFAQYRNFEGGRDLFRAQYENLCEYLMLWEMTEHGVASRDGTQRWFDNLYNIDEQLLENALYYSACAFMKKLGADIGEHGYDETLDDRMSNIAEYIDGLWDGLGYSSSGAGYDDRANAWVVLAGLVPDERKAAVSRLLAATVQASPYMEWAAIEALCKLDRRDLALKRLRSRYALAAQSEASTLGEDFNGYGTACQGYQSAVAFELIQLLGGIEIKNGASEITITPDFNVLKDFKVSLMLATGELDVRYKYSQTRIDVIIENRTSAGVTLDIAPERIGRTTERRTIILNKGKNKFTI